MSSRAHSRVRLTLDSIFSENRPISCTYTHRYCCRSRRIWVQSHFLSPWW